MDAAQPSSRGRLPNDVRARRPPHRPGSRTLPTTHPAVRWAVRHPAAGTTRRPRRPSRSDLIRRSLGRQLDRGFRPDIEGLRALAVTAVVVYHARLLGVQGGFVGVDVFFVVSGFLITRLIVGELAGTGGLSLRTFWARRARRLLAASALVVAATALGSHLVLAPLTQRTVVTDVVAAATFTSNFVFAGRLGSYFGAQLAESTPSPLLHFWSLAVEEQFYLCWPPLLVLLTRRPRQYRRLVLTMVVVLGGLGFVLAAWLTPRAPSWAFFLLPTRMGELLAGALLAVVGSGVRRIPAAVRAALAWTGLALVVWACFRFDEAMAWPGTAVLVPVLGTMAVILGGSVTRLAWSPARPLSAAGSAVDRASLLRPLPVALAGAGARRRPLGPAHLDPETGRRGRRRRALGALVPIRRGSRPARPCPGHLPRPQPGVRRGDGAGDAAVRVGPRPLDPAVRRRRGGGEPRAGRDAGHRGVGTGDRAAASDVAGSTPPAQAGGGAGHLADDHAADDPGPTRQARRPDRPARPARHLDAADPGHRVEAGSRCRRTCDRRWSTPAIAPCPTPTVA